MSETAASRLPSVGSSSRAVALTDWVNDRARALGHGPITLPDPPLRAVVGVDGHPGSQFAARWAAALAPSLDLVFAYGGYSAPRTAPLPPSMARSWEGTLENDARVAFHAVERVLGATAVRRHRINDGAAHGITAVAEDAGAPLVAVGAASGGLLDRLLLGSVTEALAHQCPLPVLVAKTDPRPGPVVVAMSDDTSAAEALRWGTAIALWQGRPLTLVHASEHPPRTWDHRDGPDSEALTVSPPPLDSVLSTTERLDAPLLVVGHGRRPGWLGSTALRMVRESATSVLVTHGAPP